jgi:hypothetical protein
MIIISIHSNHFGARASAVDNSATVGVQGLARDVGGVLRGKVHITGRNLTGLAWAPHLGLRLPGFNHLLQCNTHMKHSTVSPTGMGCR